MGLCKHRLAIEALVKAARAIDKALTWTRGSAADNLVLVQDAIDRATANICTDAALAREITMKNLEQEVNGATD